MRVLVFTFENSDFNLLGHLLRACNLSIQLLRSILDKAFKGEL